MLLRSGRHDALSSAAAGGILFQQLVVGLLIKHTSPEYFPALASEWWPPNLESS